MERRRCNKCNGEMIYERRIGIFRVPLFFLSLYQLSYCFNIIPIIVLILCVMSGMIPYRARCKDCGNMIPITKEEYKEITRL